MSGQPNFPVTGTETLPELGRQPMTGPASTHLQCQDGALCLPLQRIIRPSWLPNRLEVHRGASELGQARIPVACTRASHDLDQDIK